MKVRLEGVNRLLRTIGEIPLVDEADFALSEEAVQAEGQIESTLVKVLSQGFKFNKFTLDLLPDVDGYIAVPPNTLVIQFTKDALSVNNGLVFDQELLSSKFTEPIEVMITYREDFDNLPIVVQEHIIAEASFVFQRDVINDSAKNAELRETKAETRKDLNVYKINQAKANGKDSRFARNSNPIAQ